ncbi:fluoride efflux transporter CrcB [Kushneria phosphatilytica]|uniref:Fluoride-specific ion channel FluC n=1 Tax=Kushneria phosphatilytica TaxID=657387 RepID=A0A1S1NS01_9GAMM|nr:fluoride efflux transporter CrcB [Kushneria phosphatilytica]OHV07709.1 fluoride ion transporter CrcB [Kushneria phosphatilytica]QEL10206.1 fluoride efflux transporter CrcB [Kushneria phosphatilytica]
MWLSMVAIGAGAALGANLRWLLGLGLNSLFPAIPPGTLVANLLGAWLIGIAIALFAALPELSPQWRMFIVTGFLGALTTFSTFSAEMFSNLQAGRYGMALTGIGIHVAGSLIMTGLGMATLVAIRQIMGVAK